MKNNQEERIKELEYEQLMKKKEEKLFSIEKTHSGSFLIRVSAVHNKNIPGVRVTKEEGIKVLNDSFDDLDRIGIRDIMNEFEEFQLKNAILKIVEDSKELPIESIKIEEITHWLFYNYGIPYITVSTINLNPRYDLENSFVGYDIDILLASTNEYKSKEKKDKDAEKALVDKAKEDLKSDSLRLELMMYGKVKRSRLVYDENGDKIIIGYTKSGNPKYEKESFHEQLKAGQDVGIYPSVNRIYVGRGVYSDMARDKIKEWKEEASFWAEQSGWTKIKKNTQIYADFYFYMPKDNISRDTHNVFKMMLDALEDIIYENDKDVLPRIQFVGKTNSKKEAYVEIKFSLA